MTLIRRLAGLWAEGTRRLASLFRADRVVVRPENAEWTGIPSDITAWNVALAAEEVAQLAEVGSPQSVRQEHLTWPAATGSGPWIVVAYGQETPPDLLTWHHACGVWVARTDREVFLHPAPVEPTSEDEERAQTLCDLARQGDERTFRELAACWGIVGADQDALWEGTRARGPEAGRGSRPRGRAEEFDGGLSAPPPHVRTCRCEICEARRRGGP